MLTSEFFLADHLFMESVHSLEEVVNLATLFVALRVLHHLVLGLRGEELAHTWHWEHYLLQAAVLTYNLLQVQDKK